MTPWLWVLAAVALMALLWVALHTAARVRRLNRLHARIDAAWAGLESALARRAEAALVVATVSEAAGRPGEPLRNAVQAARAARRTGDDDREAAENALGRLLACTDRSLLSAAVLEELVDAEQLVILARRVHNDAVRDTLGLRSRRMVRWLHLAGTVALPRYFDIADPGPGVTTAAPTEGRTAPAGRTS